MAVYPDSPRPGSIEIERLQYDMLSDDWRRVTRQVRRRHLVMHRRVSLRYPSLSVAQFELFLNFYTARRGPAERFEYVHPVTGEQYMVRFAAPLQWAHIPHSDRYMLTVELKEAP
jgi:hypothetical protein